ncbi:MAG: peptide ABC transporter substrate-binding protein [Anaerolineae bacterium]
MLLALTGPPQSLNPITDGSPALRPVTPLLFDSLLRANPETAQLQPGLAQAWQFSADGRQVTFSLPPNLAWSDGTPYTAADVAASLEATQHPALLKFSRISAATDQTLQLDFLEPDCAAVTSLALLPLLPAGQILSPAPAGSGPFVVAGQSDDGGTLRLAPNPHYAGSTPRLSEIELRFFSQRDLEIVLSEGAGAFSAIGPLEQRPATPPGFRELTYPAARAVGVAINFAPKNDPPLPEPVRRALHLALNRPAILAELLAGDAALPAGTLLPGHWAAATLSPPEYNPTEAARLLAEAGLRDGDADGWLELDGQRLELALRLDGTNRLHQRLGWLVSSYYRDLGLFARAESVPRDSVMDDLFTHDFTLAIFGWPILPDPDQRVFWHTAENEPGLGLNFTSYSNPALDSLMTDAATLPGCEEPARAAAYQPVQETLNSDRPVDFVLVPNQHLFVSERLYGLQPGPFAPFTWNAAEWYLEE